MSEELRQIHKMRSMITPRFVEDPETGGQRMTQVKRYVADDTDRISSGGETFEISPDRSFYVPLSVAQHLLRMPDWHEGPNPFAPDPEEEKQRAAKPRKPAGSAA